MYNIPNELLIHLTFCISTHRWDQAYVVSGTGLLELLAFAYTLAALHVNCRIGCTATADSTFDTHMCLVVNMSIHRLVLWYKGFDHLAPNRICDFELLGVCQSL